MGGEGRQRCSKLFPFEPPFGVRALRGWGEMRLGFALKADSNHKKGASKAGKARLTEIPAENAGG